MQPNRNYDAAFCGSLPLHQINLVQNYGVLVVVKNSDLSIIQVSENIEAATGEKAATFINKPISNYILPNQLATLKEKFQVDITAKVPINFTFTISGKQVNFLGIVHSKDDYLILELEQINEDESRGESFIDVYQEVKFCLANINLANNTADICHTAVTELKKISGFDKIMVYEFDENWNGTVVAEVMEEGMDSYLGLRFPASDIPKQARALYFKNPYRLIPTIDYVPSKIYPVINPVAKAFVDLSNCNLRSVAAVHIEYLKNMGVMASMSTAIIKDDKLWGLISCHHRSPKYLSYEKCSLFELLAGVVSSRLSTIQNKEELDYSTALQAKQAELVKQVYADDSLVAGLTKYPVNILELLVAEGAAIITNKNVELVGKTPAKAEVKDLILWLQNNAESKTFTIANLAANYDEAAAFADVASGIIVLPIQKEKGEFIIGFRPEVIQKVDWGGNPNEAIIFQKDTLKYHPRNSFKLWQEEVKQTSLPWSKTEIAIAESFRNFVIEFTLQKVYGLV